MTMSYNVFAILLLGVFHVKSQFLFQPAAQPFGGFFNQQPAFQPQNFFQQFQLPTLPPPTTTLAPIPDPDKEPGNFPLPNPRNWPVGPDWNDPKNTVERQLGWGGNGGVQPLDETTTSVPKTSSKRHLTAPKKPTNKVLQKKPVLNTAVKSKRAPALPPKPIAKSNRH